MDAYKNFAVSKVATAPSPATSGTSLTVESGNGTYFSSGANAVICPDGEQPTWSNAEIVRVTAISTDTLTITRAQEGTTARSVAVGDVIFQGITDKWLDDLLNGQFIVDATGKTTPVDADTMPLIDSADSNKLKKLTWANLKATIKAYYDSVTATLTNKTINGSNNNITIVGDVPSYGGNSISAGTSGYSISSASLNYIDSTNFKQLVNLKYGKLVRVDLAIYGLYNTDTSKSIYFNVGRDGLSTVSNTGNLLAARAGWAGNWAVDGSSCGAFIGTFFFENTGTGNHTFYPLWHSQDTSTTAYIRPYARCCISVQEIFVPLIPT